MAIEYAAMETGIEYKTFAPDEHLSGILALCEAEGWESFVADHRLAAASLAALGVSTVVAVSYGEVVGFAQIQSDGVLQAHLSNVAVDRGYRGRGVGKRLVAEVFERGGGERVDLISTEDSEPFYESFAHKGRPGYRIYPQSGRAAK